MRFKKYKLKDVCNILNCSVKPLEHISYNLYSLPAFDNDRNPERVKGEQILSNKLNITNDTILFNKLNVRYRRVWNIHKINDGENICSTEFIPLKVNNEFDQDYVYYFLITESVTKELNAASKGTSTSHQRIDSNVLMNLDLELPDLECQQKISRFLCNIDTKIATNNKINKNLAA